MQSAKSRPVGSHKQTRWEAEASQQGRISRKAPKIVITEKETAPEYSDAVSWKYMLPAEKC